MGYERRDKLLFLKDIQCFNTQNDVIFSGYRGRKLKRLTYSSQNRVRSFSPPRKVKCGLWPHIVSPTRVQSKYQIFKCNLQFIKVISRPFQVVGDFNMNLYYVPNLKVTQRPIKIEPLVKVVSTTGCNKKSLLICNCRCTKDSYPNINKLNADTNTLLHSIEYCL
jgi:hypothetical protein